VEPIFLAVLTVERRLLEKRTPSIVWDVDTLSVLRSVVMKPEHAAWIPELQTALERHLD
jgi:hypothetical protein